MNALLQDLRFAARMLRKNVGFSLVAMVTLALGIGANTAIFSVVNAVLLKPLPFAEPDQLMVVQEATTTDEGDGISYPNFLDVRANNSVFDSVAVFTSTHATLTGDAPARMSAAVVSANLFTLLGVVPSLGRTFLPEEDQRGGSAAGRPVILSHSLWQTRFGSDPNVLGRPLALDNLQFTIVGVMPANFRFPVQNEPVELWTTVAVDAEPSQYGGSILTSRGYPHYTAAIARLKQNVTPQQAQSELDALASGLRQQHSRLNANWKLKATPALEWLVGDVRPLLLVLFGAVGFVLLIACANVANLLLARATVRHRDIAIRSALGASRLRIVRLLLTESIMLALAGGALGLLLALWGVDLLASLTPENVPRVADISVDGRVAVFTLAASLVTGLVFGLAPALSVSKVNLTDALKEGGRGGDGGLRRSRLRNTLTIVEVALALTLLIGAGLLIQSFARLQGVEPGFDPHNTLTFSVSLPEATYVQNSPQITLFYDQLLERVRQLPGVRAASVAQTLPLSGDDNSTSVELEGRPSPVGERPSAGLRFIGLNYFGTMSIPLVAGRDFDGRDNQQTSEKLIVNEAFVRRFFPDGNPLGRRMTLGFGGDDAKEIVGVVGNVRHGNLSIQPQPEMYVPVAQFPINSLTVIVRAAGDPYRLANSAQQAVHALDKDLPVYNVRTLDEYLAQSIAQPRFNTLLLNLFAGVALTLAVIGIYGVIAYSVSSRAHEIGIRIALGAQSGDVLRLILRQGLTLILTGVAIGLVAAFLLSRVIASFLFETSATDPATFVGVAALLSTVAFIACYIPARRATRIDPIIALRYE